MPDNPYDALFSPANPRERVHGIASKIGISPDIADDYLKITKVESGHNINVGNSAKGAQGFGQVMPDRPGLSVRTISGRRYNLQNPDENVEAGLRLFSAGGDDPVGRRLEYFGGAGARRRYERTGRIPNISDGNLTAQQYVRATGEQQAPKPTPNPYDALFSSAGSQPPSESSEPVRQADHPPPLKRRFETSLSPDDEQRFQQWKQTYAPNDTGDDYDLRGAFKSGLTPDAKTGHWPDTFKKPNHPTFSNEIQYATGEYAARAGHWEGDKFVPPPPPAPPSGGLTPENAAWHAAWHFGPMDGKPLTRRQARVLAEAVAEDERKKAAGEQIIEPSTEYQNKMRKRAGMRPLQYNLGATQMKVGSITLNVPFTDKARAPYFRPDTAPAPLPVGPRKIVTRADKPFSLEGDRSENEIRRRIIAKPDLYTGEEYRSFLLLNRSLDSDAQRQAFVDLKLKQQIAHSGSARNILVGEEVEQGRQQRVAKMTGAKGWAQYLSQVPKSAALGVTDTFATMMKSIAVGAMKLDEVIGTESYKGKETTDLATYQLGEYIQREARSLLGSDADLEQETLIGQTPQTIGQVASFVLGGWATKAPKLATVILGVGMTTGDAYDEVRAAGGTDEQAVNAGLLAGALLGPTELIGMNGAMRAITDAPAKQTWRLALKKALKEGSRDIVENVLQEMGQEWGQGEITGKRRTGKEVLMAGLQGAVGGGVTIPTSLIAHRPIKDARPIEPSADIIDRASEALITLPEGGNRPTATESPAAIHAQMDALVNGRGNRYGVLIPKGQTAPSRIPKGFMTTRTSEGVVIHPKELSSDDVRELVDDGNSWKLLGHQNPNDPLATRVVIARAGVEGQGGIKPGTELLSSYVVPGQEQNAIEEMRAQFAPYEPTFEVGGQETAAKAVEARTPETPKAQPLLNDAEIAESARTLSLPENEIRDAAALPYEELEHRLQQSMQEYDDAVKTGKSVSDIANLGIDARGGLYRNLIDRALSSRTRPGAIAAPETAPTPAKPSRFANLSNEQIESYIANTQKTVEHRAATLATRPPKGTRRSERQVRPAIAVRQQQRAENRIREAAAELERRRAGSEAVPGLDSYLQTEAGGEAGGVNPATLSAEERAVYQKQYDDLFYPTPHHSRSQRRRQRGTGKGRFMPGRRAESSSATNAGSARVAPEARQQVASSLSPEAPPTDFRKVESKVSGEVQTVPAKEPTVTPPAEVKTQSAATESQLTTVKEAKDVTQEAAVVPIQSGKSLSRSAQKALKQAESPEGKTVRLAPMRRIGAPKTDASRNSVEQQVRSYGGIKDDADLAYKGELSWLRESGKRGTINQTGGISVEEMATRLAQDGYGKGVWWEGAANNVDPQAFLQAVMDDTRGQKHYSTERDVIEDDPDVIAWDALVEDEAGKELIERVQSGHARAADIVQFVREASAHGLSDPAIDAFVAGLQRTVQEELSGGVEEGEGYSLNEDGTLLDPDGTPLFSRAFHGSPYDFDKFSTDKIGTGEGAQSYGYGLYFTDKKEIAEHYRSQLANDQPSTRILADGKPLIDWFPDNNIASAVGVEVEHFGLDAKKALESTDRDSTLPYLKQLQDAKITIARPGKTYEVELAPKEDEYLLWDKPLSEQSETVKKALTKAFQEIEPPEGGKPYADRNPDGQSVYATISSSRGFSRNFGKGDTQWSAHVPSEKAGSEYLHSLGIRGIKYLDQGSRHSDYEARWSEDNKHALVYKRGADTPAKQFDTFAEADKWIDENTPKSYNYVIFSDQDVEIVQRPQLAREFQLGLPAEGLTQQAAPPQPDDQRERLRREQQERDEAVDPVRAAAQRKLEEIRRRGMTVDEYSRQGSMFEAAPSGVEIKLLREIERGQPKPESGQSMLTKESGEPLFSRGVARFLRDDTGRISLRTIRTRLARLRGAPDPSIPDSVHELGRRFGVIASRMLRLNLAISDAGRNKLSKVEVDELWRQHSKTLAIGENVQRKIREQGYKVNFLGEVARPDQSFPSVLKNLTLSEKVKEFFKGDADSLGLFGRVPTGWESAPTAPEKFPPLVSVEGNHVKLENSEASELLTAAYVALGLTPRKTGVGGVFTAQPENVARQLDKMAREGAKEMAAAFREAAKAGEGKVTAAFGMRSKQHEQFHQSSHAGNRYLQDRHRDFNRLTNHPAFPAIRAALVEQMSYPDSVPTLVEEAAAYISSGDYLRLGLSRKQAIDWMQLWFESFVEHNGEVSIAKFGELANEAQQALAAALNQATEKREGRSTDQDVRSLQEGRESRAGPGDNESAAIGQHDREGQIISLVDEVSALYDPETGGLTRGGDYVRQLMEQRSDTEVKDLLAWTRQHQSEFVKRFIGGNVDAELRARENRRPERDYQQRESRLRSPQRAAELRDLGLNENEIAAAMMPWSEVQNEMQRQAKRNVRRKLIKLRLEDLKETTSELDDLPPLFNLGPPKRRSKDALERLEELAKARGQTLREAPAKPAVTEKPVSSETKKEASKVTGFTTSQGSTYTISGESTQRTKTLHVGHDPKDVGLKRPSDRTVYLEEEGAREVGMWNTLNASGKHIIVHGDEVWLTSMNPKENKRGRDGRFKFSTEAEVGKSPLELWDRSDSLNKEGREGYRGNHPGTPIKSLSTETTRPPFTIVPPPTRRAAGPTPEGQTAERSFPKTAESVGYRGGTDRDYTVLTNAASLESAQRRLTRLGAGAAAAELAQSDNPGAEDNALGILLMQQFERTGQIGRAVAVANDLSRKLTQAGQFVQAASIITRLSPEGVLLHAQKILKGKPLAEETAQTIIGQAKAVTDAERLVAEIQRQRPDIFGPNGEILPRVTAQETKRDTGTRVTTQKGSRAKIGKLQDRLAKMEQDARARIEARKAKPDNVLSFGGLGSSKVAADLGDLVIIGAAKLARSGITQAVWLAEMAKEATALTKKDLRKLYRESFEMYERERKQFLQESRVRGAQRQMGTTTASAADVQRVINERLDAMTAARKARAELSRTFRDLNAGRTVKILRGVRDVWGLTRALITSVDISAGGRQGKMGMVTHPKAWLRGFARQFRGMSKKQYERMVSEIQADPDYKYAVRFKLELTSVARAETSSLAAHEEVYQTELADKIPWLRISQQAYDTMLDTLRMGWFKAQLAKLRTAGVDLEDPANKEMLVHDTGLINKFTGRGGDARLRRISSTANAFAFSIRFWASRLEVLALPLNPRMYGIGEKAYSPTARADAWKTVFGHYGLVALQIALARLAGAEVNFDPDDPDFIFNPDNPDFLKVKFGGIHHVDFSAGLQSHLRVAARLAKSFYLREFRKEKPRTGPAEIVGKYLRSKEEPNVALIHDLFFSDKKGTESGPRGTNYAGEPVYLTGKPGTGAAERIGSSAIAQRILPIVLQDALAGWKISTGPGSTALALTASVLGEGVTTYSKGYSEKKEKWPMQPELDRLQITINAPQRVKPGKNEKFKAETEEEYDARRRQEAEAIKVALQRLEGMNFYKTLPDRSKEAAIRATITAARESVRYQQPAQQRKQQTLTP